MDTNAVRRKIVKGSLAAPVVLTVSSASASAATSFGRCLRNAANAQPAFFADEKRLDNWLRKQVEIVELSKHQRAEGWFYLDPVRNRYVSVRAPHEALPFGARLPDGWNQTGRAKRWALVYFEGKSAKSYRHITLQRPNGYMPATVSCYSSFRV